MPDGSNQASEGQPGFVPAALFGLCPQCGARTLFAGLARFAPRCGVCGLDYGQFNVGDGPAAFLTLVIGTVTLLLALWVEFSWHPPFWVHGLLWVPFVAGTTLWGLRVAKAALLVTEFRRDAGEGRLKDQ